MLVKTQETWLIAKMLENYIPQISFAMTAIIAVFISDYFFTGTKKGVKTFLSGFHWSTKKEGFIVFLVSVVIIIPLATILLQRFIESILIQYQQNLIWIIVGFLVICFLYFNKKYYNHWL